MKDISSRVPVNKTAALVTGSGEEFVSRKKITTVDSPTPIKTIGLGRVDYNMAKMVAGYISNQWKCGRLQVVGLYSTQPLRFIMRCQCGTYTVRRSKAVRNRNNYDMCEECRHLMHLKRAEYWRRTGKDITTKELDGIE